MSMHVKQMKNTYIRMEVWGEGGGGEKGVWGPCGWVKMGIV